MYYIGKYWPMVCCAITALLFYKFQNSILDIDKIMDKVIGTAVTICATLLGFLLTITTIVSTIDTRRMRFVRQAGAYPILQKYMKVSIYSNIFALSISLLSPLFLACTNSKLCINYTFMIEGISILYAWLVSIRFTYVFVDLLHDPEEANN